MPYVLLVATSTLGRQSLNRARHHDENAIRLGYKLRMGLHLSSVGHFGAGWINDRYFDSDIKVLRQWDAHFLARPASA